MLLLALQPLRAESDPLKSVAADLAKEIRKHPAVKTAVLGLIHHDNHASDGTALLSDRLASRLAAEKGVSVVERDRLEQALDELLLSRSGVMDPQTVKSLGKTLGADVIVTGTIINLPRDKSEINVRALWAQNGRVLAASRAIVDRTWRDRRRLADDHYCSSVYASNALKATAEKLGAALPKKPAMSVAVLNFPYSRGRSSTGSHLVSERLVTHMVQNGSSVVERRLLGKLLEERKLWESGLMPPEAMKNVGGILSVDAVITGFLTDLSATSTEMLVRVVRVDTGEIISSASGLIDRIWGDAPSLPAAVQPRSAVPVAFVPKEPFEETPEPVRAPIIIQNSGRRGPQHRRYYPAPVPNWRPSK